MRFGVVGAGHFGSALATRLADTGYEVMLSNSRGPQTLARLVASIPGRVSAGTVAEAAGFGDIVGVAVPVQAFGALPPAAFAGKIVIDVNNYYPQPGGRIDQLDSGKTTSSQLLASLLPGATVVKAFNTIYFQRLLNQARIDLPVEQRLAVPVSADDSDAKQTVLELIHQLGFAGVDAGTLAESDRLQPGSPLYFAFAETRRRNAVLTIDDVRRILSTPRLRSS